MPETVPENISGAFLHKHLFQFMVFGDPLLFVMLYPSRQFVQDSNAKISFTKAVIFGRTINRGIRDQGFLPILERDVSPLSGLVSLASLDLWYNLVSDLNPLVLNAGIDSEDLLDVTSNPLDTTSCTVHIPTLEGRGVTVDHDCT